jgi:hypothetical protein
MALTDGERTDVRRYCGYPVWSGGVIEVFGAIAYQTTGTLEFRMNNLTDSEEAVLRRYLGTLTVLEVAVPRAGENLDTDQAAVWTRNRTEPEDRLRLLDSWRRRLCQFLGVPPGPGLISSNSPPLVV